MIKHMRELSIDKSFVLRYNYRNLILLGENMDSVKRQYRETVNILGATLLVWVVLFMILSGLSEIVGLFVPVSAGPVALEIITSIAYDISYLLAFMLPALFFRLLSKGKQTQSMRLEIKPSRDTLPIIFASVAMIFAFSYANGVFISLFETAEYEPIFNEAPYYMEDYGFVLQFITIALVPAFCEEFLFRGVILSNLMPYGKATAIIISSVLFGLMHSNFYQFLYTVAAGILLGAIYVMTDSIWCSVLVHMINNSTSIFQSAIYERFDEGTAFWIVSAFDGVILLLGFVSAIYLIAKYGKKTKKASGELKSMFGSAENTDGVVLGTSAAISVHDTISGFLRAPAIVMFIICSILSAIGRLV